MNKAIERLRDSLNRIREVANEMDSRPLPPAAQRRLDETLRCSCTVILSGFFESFLRDLAEACVTEFASRGVPFNALPSRLQHTHFVQGGRLLGEKTRELGRVAWIAGDHFDIVRRLASPADNPKNYVLLWEAYAGTRGNPGPKAIEDILVSLGVSQCRKRLDQALGGNYPSKSLALSSFIAVRNECAHTGTASNVPTPADLRSYCDLLDEIAVAIITVLRHRLSVAPFGFDLNAAGKEELCQIPGLGERRAKRVLRFRTSNGPFSRVDDLRRVPGFGPKLVTRCGEHVFVQ
jgi:competence ComEA-like helix-hairpin-helix protein